MFDHNAALARLVARDRRESFSAETICFPAQRALVRDSARYRVAVCSRRAGKTVASAVLLLERALAKPRSSHVYVTLSRVNAKRIVWRQLLDLNHAHRLGGVANETELYLRLPNRATIYLSGAKDHSEIEKFRGLSLDTCVIDEGQAFRPYLRTLIDDVIVPCLWDTQGALVLIGTPGPVPVGPFHEAWTGRTWRKHAWTILDNPWIERMTGKSPAMILAEERERRGIGEDDPTYQRESLGRWVRDESALVVCYDPSRNDYQERPGGVWSYVFGVDLGTDDADAVAVLGWPEHSRTLYLVEEYVERGNGLTELMTHVERMRKIYDPRRIVIDTGGIGKKISEEIRRRWGVPVEPAEKTRKLEHIALMNDALRTGALLAKRDSVFAGDSALLQWEPDAKGRVISGAYHSDIIDAVLYGYRAAGHYLEEPPVEKRDEGEEWEAAEEEKRCHPWWERETGSLWR
jgi:hypothetical protein